MNFPLSGVFGPLSRHGMCTRSRSGPKASFELLNRFLIESAPIWVELSADRTVYVPCTEI